MFWDTEETPFGPQYTLDCGYGIRLVINQWMHADRHQGQWMLNGLQGGTVFLGLCSIEEAQQRAESSLKARLLYDVISHLAD